MPEAVRTMSLDADYTPLRDKVRDEIRQRIIDGVYAPGLRIIEIDIATQLGVSRAPVREAIRALESEGFLTVVPRKGVMVSVLAERDVEELFDIREALEVLACRRAAQRATGDEMEALREQLDRARQALKAGDLAAFGMANETFHDEIIVLAGNSHLARVIEPLQGRLHWLLRQTDQPAELCEEHEALFEAIASGDPDAAGAQALRHVQANRIIALELLFHAKRPDESVTA